MSLNIDYLRWFVAPLILIDGEQEVETKEDSR